MTTIIPNKLANSGRFLRLLLIFATLFFCVVPGRSSYMSSDWRSPTSRRSLLIDAQEALGHKEQAPDERAPEAHRLAPPGLDWALAAGLLSLPTVRLRSSAVTADERGPSIAMQLASSLVISRGPPA